MNECYEQEILRYSDPVFKRIKTSVLITMKDSPRRSEYLKQLCKFRPTARIIILHNKGFATCQKPEWVNSTAMDLWHANITSLQLTDKPVLILEDDVEFLESFTRHAAEIERFITNKDVDIYSLGSLPLLSIPVNRDHIRMYVGGCAHAWIYTESGARKMVNAKRVIGFHDIDISSQLRTYVGREPCAIQKLNNTANSKLWNFANLPITYFRCFGDKTFAIHQLFGLFGGLFGGLLLVVSCIFLIVSLVSHY